MNRHVTGVWIGMLAAALLTPVVRAIWVRAFPPKVAETLNLPPQNSRACTHIDFEATVFGVFMPAILAMIYGFGTRLDFAKGVMVVTSIFAGYTVWTLVRLGLKGRQWFSIYAIYLEGKYRVSAKSAVIVVGGIALFFVAAVLASLFAGPG